MIFLEKALFVIEQLVALLNEMATRTLNTRTVNNTVSS